ncbi:hypothetical protein BCR43DRAFT_499025 [Syncephalastrum racemosum]|uniref:Homeobox domain-containing protein n=1 Tax=Syncephalastrum racemosum TaxID=13706 RepID=A0A1X2H211_SYNRA|nr:hypothetical protein BCR43DRAFT_499025 [Syncephalastrum racemosum]
MSTFHSLAPKRVFSPVILFHDHRFVRDESVEHVHIPFDGDTIDQHKERIHRMLEDNRRFWSDVMTACAHQDNPTTTAVASCTLAEKAADYSPASATSPTPPLSAHDLPGSPPAPSSSLSTTSSYSSASSSASSFASPPARHAQPSLPKQRPQRLRRSSSLRPPPSPEPSSASSTSSTLSHTFAKHYASPHVAPQQSMHKDDHRRKQQHQQQVVKSVPRKQRSNLPKPITAILKDWLARHKRHPYPNEEEKAQLVQQTGLARNQISNWFINARRRILQTMLDQAEDDDEDESPCGPLPAFGVFADPSRFRKRTAAHIQDASPNKRLKPNDTRK